MVDFREDCGRKRGSKSSQIDANKKTNYIPSVGKSRRHRRPLDARPVRADSQHSVGHGGALIRAQAEELLHWVCAASILFLHQRYGALPLRRSHHCQVKPPPPFSVEEGSPSVT